MNNYLKCVFIIFITIIFICCVNIKKNFYEKFENKKLLSNDISSKKYNNNLKNLKNIYDNNLSIKKVKGYYDPSIFSCIKNVNTPLLCTAIKGNYINVFPISFCKSICPNIIKKDIEKIYESFDNLKEEKDYYYCIYGEKCKKKPKNYFDISKNTCGKPSISQVPFEVYDDKKTCEKALNPCKNLGEKECKLNYNCGWCTNSLGQGKCVEGTPDGPLNLEHTCIPQNGKKGNNYTQGMPKQFISPIDFGDYFSSLN